MRKGGKRKGGGKVKNGMEEECKKGRKEVGKTE